MSSGKAIASCYTMFTLRYCRRLSSSRQERARAWWRGAHSRAPGRSRLDIVGRRSRRPGRRVDAARVCRSAVPRSCLWSASRPTPPRRRARRRLMSTVTSRRWLTDAAVVVASTWVQSDVYVASCAQFTRPDPMRRDRLVASHRVSDNR